jgi:hypothetical protein
MLREVAVQPCTSPGVTPGDTSAICGNVRRIRPLCRGAQAGHRDAPTRRTPPSAGRTGATSSLGSGTSTRRALRGEARGWSSVGRLTQRGQGSRRGESQDTREIVWTRQHLQAAGARPPGHTTGTPAVHPGSACRGAPATRRPAWRSAHRRFIPHRRSSDAA